MVSITRAWDITEGHVRRNPRKYAVLGFLILVLPQAAPAAVTAAKWLWAFAPAATKNLGSQALTMGLPFSWNWITAPVGLALMFLVWRETRGHPPEPAGNEGVEVATIAVYTHDEALKNNPQLETLVTNLFAKTGWRVVPGLRTNVQKHAKGIWIRGGTSFEREMAKWGLENIGVEWQPDYHGEPPATLQVIVGAYTIPKNRQLPASDAISVEQLAATNRALDEAQREGERLRGLLGNEEQALSQCRSDLACMRLKVFGAKYPGKRVTVRYINFSDNQFAEHLAFIFQRHAGWQATPTRDSTSHLIQETQWRIVFSSGDSDLIKGLWEIFMGGNLAGEPISPMEIMDKQTDDPEVIVTIFPKQNA